MAIAGKKARIKVSGAPVAFANEATTGDVARVVYQINDAGKRVWAREAALTVEQSLDNGVTWNAVSAYTPNRLNGSIIFSSARAAGALVRVSGQYLPLTIAAECSAYSYSLKGRNETNNHFESDWTLRTQTLLDATGSLSKWTNIDRYFEDALLAGDPVVLEIFSDKAAAADLRAWALLAADDMSGAIGGVQQTAVEWEGAADADGRAISTAN